MLEINSYSFGRMTINNVVVSSDLMILPNGKIIDNWRRNQGHLLKFNDIKSLIKSKPEILVVGTGASGMMRVAQDLLQALEKNGIMPDISPCSQAIKKFNTHAAGGKRVAACFHLTC